jgi:hypothetical protein
MQMHTDLDASTLRCVDDCLACYSTCRSMAANHCLEHGGEHVYPPHMRLMLACAELCRAAADLMLLSSPHHTRLCAVCAEACEDCAQSCEALGDMQACVQACRRCARSCSEMAREA